MLGFFRGLAEKTFHFFQTTEKHGEFSENLKTSGYGVLTCLLAKKRSSRAEKKLHHGKSVVTEIFENGIKKKSNLSMHFTKNWKKALIEAYSKPMET